MRIWTINPRYLDARGLVALWREALLAQRVLSGRTKGYRHHPQLERFRAHDRPLEAIGTYLSSVANEAARRGYRFDRSRIESTIAGDLVVPATIGQLRFEWAHLMQKLTLRAPDVARAHEHVDSPAAHPLFEILEGPIAPWERAAAR